MADNVVRVVLPSTGLTISQWVNEITTIDAVQTSPVAINCLNTNTFLVNLDPAGGEHTFTLTNLKVGQTVKITVVQPPNAGGNVAGTITWGGSGSQSIRWTDNTAPTLTTTLGNADELVLYGASGTTVPGDANMIGGTLALANF